MSARISACRETQSVQRGATAGSGLRAGDKHDPVQNQAVVRSHRQWGGEGCALPELKVVKDAFQLALLTAWL